MLPHQQQQQQQLQQSQQNDFRKRQIDTLKVFNDNVVEVAENEEYCVHFESAARNLLLTVILPENFPSERPKLHISPIVQHSWVNASNGEIETAPGLLNYTPHSDLGRIVQAIIREFERFPPVILRTAGSPMNIPQRNSAGISSSSSGIGGGVVGVTNSATNSTMLTTAKSLDSSSINIIGGGGVGAAAMDNMDALKFNDNSLPNLSTLSLDELKQLDKDPEFFNDFIEEMSVVQHLNEDLDSMITQVENISRENEAKETNLLELKRKLSDDVTALKNLGEKCDQLNKKYLKKSEQFAPQHIRELIQIAASNADTECDRHVEHFLNGKIDVQTFLNNYQSSKKLSSERKAKEERLGQQLSALERAGF